MPAQERLMGKVKGHRPADLWPGQRLSSWLRLWLQRRGWGESGDGADQVARGYRGNVGERRLQEKCTEKGGTA